jgi:hypothetical protein
MRLTYFLVSILIFITLFSCRKDKEFVINEETVVPKEEIDTLKDIERRLLIWRSKKNFTTLEKYLDAKEKHLKYSKNIEGDLSFLSEYYFYLSFTTKIKKNKLYALNKANLNSRKLLKILSPKYKEKIDSGFQDYQAIELVDSNSAKALYWYINNLIFLRVEEENIVLYRDDIEKSLSVYNYLIKSNKKDILDLILLYHLPKIANGDKTKAIEELKKLESDNQLDIFIKEMYLSENPTESSEKILKLSKSNDFKSEVFLKMVEINFQLKK